MAGWTYPTYPNAETQPNEIEDMNVDCFNGCLFNVHEDPSELTDIASLEPVRVQQMKKRLEELREGFYENDERGMDSCPKGYNDSDSSLLWYVLLVTTARFSSLCLSGPFLFLCLF